MDVNTDSSSDEEVTSLLLSLCNRRRKRRWWVNDTLRRRHVYGEFHHLIKELQYDDERFFQYFRMYKGTFNDLLDLCVQSENSKEKTMFRTQIAPCERLVFCLRRVVNNISDIPRSGTETMPGVALEIGADTAVETSTDAWYGNAVLIFEIQGLEMGSLVAVFLSVFLLCVTVQLSQGRCSNAQDAKGQACFRTPDAVAAKKSLADKNYAAFCKQYKAVTHCYLKAVGDCITIKAKQKIVSDIINRNSPPSNCQIEDLDGNKYEKCMPSLLGHCTTYESQIQKNIAEDERGSDKNHLYTLTCPVVRKYYKCFKDASDGCKADIIANFEKTIDPYRNYTTYDCFPGDTEPFGMCRTGLQSLTCIPRYAQQIIQAATNEASSGSTVATCGLVQKLHDCIAIKSSGCALAVADKDILAVKKLAPRYKCTIDYCSKLWNSCLKKYEPNLMAAPASSKCQAAEELATCARFAVRNDCPTNVTNQVRMYFAYYVQNCKDFTPVIVQCDVAAIKACESFLSNLKLTQPAPCVFVDAYFGCARPLMVSSCPTAVKTAYNNIRQKYKNSPWSCDVDCPIKQLTGCFVKYMHENRGKVPKTAKIEKSRGHFRDTCKYAKEYEMCIDTLLKTCQAKSAVTFRKPLEGYTFDTMHNCHEGKWCDMPRVAQCAKDSQTKMTAARDQRTYCKHLQNYMNCVRTVKSNCPPVIEKRYQDLMALHAKKCVTGVKTTTPCVGTCGTASIAALPLVIATAAALALLARK